MRCQVAVERGRAQFGRVNLPVRLTGILPVVARLDSLIDVGIKCDKVGVIYKKMSSRNPG